MDVVELHRTGKSHHSEGFCSVVDVEVEVDFEVDMLVAHRKPSLDHTKDHDILGGDHICLELSVLVKDILAVRHVLMVICDQPEYGFSGMPARCDEFPSDFLLVVDDLVFVVLLVWKVLWFLKVLSAVYGVLVAVQMMDFAVLNLMEKTTAHCGVHPFVCQVVHLEHLVFLHDIFLMISTEYGQVVLIWTRTDNAQSSGLLTLISHVPVSPDPAEYGVGQCFALAAKTIARGRAASAGQLASCVSDSSVDEA